VSGRYRVDDVVPQWFTSAERAQTYAGYLIRTRVGVSTIAPVIDEADSSMILIDQAGYAMSAFDHRGRTKVIPSDFKRFSPSDYRVVDYSTDW
jgi:hypothetical protein